MSQKNYLITGGSGFIGSCLVRELVKNEKNSVCNILARHMELYYDKVPSNSAWWFLTYRGPKSVARIIITRNGKNICKQI